MSPKERQAVCAQRAIKAGVKSQKELTTWWANNASDESLGGVIRAWRGLRPEGTVIRAKRSTAPATAKPAKPAKSTKPVAAPATRRAAPPRSPNRPPKAKDFNDVFGISDEDFDDVLGVTGGSKPATKKWNGVPNPEWARAQVAVRNAGKNPSPTLGQWVCKGCDRTFGKNFKYCSYCMR